MGLETDSIRDKSKNGVSKKATIPDALAAAEDASAKSPSSAAGNSSPRSAAGRRSPAARATAGPEAVKELRAAAAGLGGRQPIKPDAFDDAVFNG